MVTENKYIVFDGMDGSGKGTQIALLKNKLPKVTFTHEPGGTPFAEEIRKIVRDNPLAGESTSLNNFLLFWAAREELVNRLVMPALFSGKHVLSDRGDSSTFAFQIYGEQHHELRNLFSRMRETVFETPGRRAPDMYIIFDLPADVARGRAVGDVTRTQNHLDVRDMAFYERVRSGFHEFTKKYRVEFVDAKQTPEQVHRDVMAILAREMVV